MALPRREPRILLLTIVLAALFPADAYAYLDPGTGSLFVQSLIAAIAAAGYALRLYWGRLRGLIKPPQDDSPSPDPLLQTQRDGESRP
jgi:hypothetical protein